MKHIIHLSGTIQSVHLLLILSQELPKQYIIPLITTTHSEHPEIPFFQLSALDKLDLAPTIIEHDPNTTISTLFIDSQAHNNSSLCTNILKIQPAEKYLQSLADQGIEYVEYFPHNHLEWRARQKISSAKPFAKFPLADRMITHPQSILAVAKAGIQIPNILRYFKHFTCVPCIRADEAHYKLLLDIDPQSFQKAIDLEKQAGRTIFPNISLEKLQSIWSEKRRSPLEITSLESPCRCL